MKPIVYRCRKCYEKALKKMDTEAARKQAEFAMKATPNVARTVACKRCGCTDIEIV